METGLQMSTIRTMTTTGHWISVDALPLEPRDYLDTDLDGIGNFADRDADGDGVNNTLDPFPLDSSEWLDTDDDGIGDTMGRRR